MDEDEDDEDDDDDEEDEEDDDDAVEGVEDEGLIRFMISASRHSCVDRSMEVVTGF